MSVDDSREGFWREMQEKRRRHYGKEADATLKGGGGDGTSGGMEGRIARIESDMEHVKHGMAALELGSSELRKGVTAIQVDVAKGVGEIRTVFSGLDERSKHFTTRWDVVVMLSVLFGLLSGVIALAVRFIPHAG
jgi:hypothetical protein